MATSKAQRIGIWVIAVAMTLGTVVGFLVMILSSQNDASSKAALAEYQTQYTAYQTKVSKQQSDLEARSTDLSATYNESFSARKALATAFDGTAIKTVTAEELAPGTGAEIKDDTTYTAYYIGFMPDGTIFDSSLDNGKLKTPLIVRPGGVITGWTEGMKGKKLGGTYKLSIPSDKAYGATGSPDGSIKANTPLVFIVMPIESLETLSEPKITQEIINAYGGK